MNFVPVRNLREQRIRQGDSEPAKVLSDSLNPGKKSLPNTLNLQPLLVGKIGYQVQITFNIRIIPPGAP